MKENMSRRGFFARALILLLAVLAPHPVSGRETGSGSGKPEIGKTSRKRAKHWKELAG